MARVLRVAIDVMGGSKEPPSYALHVWEQVRTANARLISAQHLGSGISEPDLEVVMQIVEDVLRSAIGRTVGIQDQLPF